MEIAEFLLARIAEDEAVARAAADFGPDSWAARPYWFTQGPQHADIPGVVEELIPAELADHIARHDPARVLAECEAKRRIVALHFADPDSGLCDVCGSRDAYPCATLRLLALPYADHPDCQPEWSPLAVS